MTRLCGDGATAPSGGQSLASTPTVRRQEREFYRMGNCRLTVSRGHPTGALHSRVIEKSIAAAKKAKTRTRLRMPPYHATDAEVPQPLGFTMKRNQRSVP